MSTSLLTSHQSKKEEIQSQLESLTKQLRQVEAEEKRQNSSSTQILAPASPSPRKNLHQSPNLSGAPSTERTTLNSRKTSTNQTPNSLDHSSGAQSTRLNSSNPSNTRVVALDRPKSNLVQDLKALRQRSKNQSIIQTTKRSTSFGTSAEKPIAPSADLRAFDLTIKVNIQTGPIRFRPRKNDPDFLEYEPNSQTRLNKRIMSHQTLQDHLADRYLVKINELYAIVKDDIDRYQGGKEWTMPLVGDWVLFGVIGQKSDFKTTTPRIASQVDRIINNNQGQENFNGTDEGNLSSSKITSLDKLEEENSLEDLNDQLELEEGNRVKPSIYQLDDKIPKKSEHQNQNNKGKKYVTFKLIDMSSSKMSASGSGVINMILFESESYIPNAQEDIKKTYIGGSRGAYEKFWKEQPGTLIGILNPKILKSRKPAVAFTHPTAMTDIITITPENAKSLIIIGKCKDLGTCVAKRSDTRKECGSWCDLRNFNTKSKKSLAVCEFHLRRQVGKVRANRAEFFSGTSGMNTYTGKKFGMDECNAFLKMGLLPSQQKATYINGMKTYISAGGGGNQLGQNQSESKKRTDRFIEPVDVEKLEGLRLKRKRELEEIELNKLLEQQAEKNDNYGLKCLQDAKRYVSNNKASNGGVQDNKSTSKSQDTNPTMTDSALDVKKLQPNRKVFSTDAIRAIGFDPLQSSSKGRRVLEDLEVVKNSTASYNDLLNSALSKSNQDAGFGNKIKNNQSKIKRGKITTMMENNVRKSKQDEDAEEDQTQNHDVADSEDDLDHDRTCFKRSKLDDAALVEPCSDDGDDDDEDDDLIIVLPKKSL